MLQLLQVQSSEMSRSPSTAGKNVVTRRRVDRRLQMPKQQKNERTQKSPKSMMYFQCSYYHKQTIAKLANRVLYG